MVYDVQRYLSVRSAYGASWSPDGDRIAFLLNTTGVPQVWTTDGPGRWPVQWTTFEERVTFVDWSPTREELAFGMDEGGDERAQLYLLDLTDGRIENLTRTPEAKHRWGGWSSSGDRFAFASNRRDEAVFDLYVQSREERGDDATRVAEGDGWLSVVGWSPDDDRLLVHEARSNVDQDLHVLDVETGDLRRVTDHDGATRYGSPEWAPDGESVYVATDADEATPAGADTRSLARLDLETAALTTVRDGGDWNVDGVSVDEDTGRIAYSRNVDGETELTVGVLDGPTTIAGATVPELPQGVAGGVDFDPTGGRLALTVSGREHNANVWVLSTDDGSAADGADHTAGADAGDAAHAASTPARWTDAPTAGIPRETFQTPELVHYESRGRADGRATANEHSSAEPLDIPALFTLPESIADGATPAEGETPVIVDVHGGPESQRRPSFSASAQFFLSQGYAVFEPNVRGSTGYGREYTHLDDVERRMDAVADLRAAHEWLADRPAIDPDRIALKGGSYGGFMVLAAMTEYPELWAAGVDVVGIANFVTFLENTGDWRRALREAEYGSLEADRELLESISPLEHVDAIDAPLFVAHGANDPRVPVGEAEQIAAAAREQGVPVELLVFDDEGHGFSKLENRVEAYRRYAAFLDEHV